MPKTVLRTVVVMKRIPQPFGRKVWATVVVMKKIKRSVWHFSVSFVDGGKRRNAAKKKELDAAEKRIAELSAIFKRLYEDSVTGRISDERFAELSADYEAEQRQLKDRAAELQGELAKAQEATVNAEKFMNIVRKYTSFEELTPTLLREFIEKIVVHECSYDENKNRRQEIEIYYSFVGKVDLPE